MILVFRDFVNKKESLLHPKIVNRLLVSDMVLMVFVLIFSMILFNWYEKETEISFILIMISGMIEIAICALEIYLNRKEEERIEN